jgi:hypothetical protein
MEIKVEKNENNALHVARQKARGERIEGIKKQDKVSISDLWYLYQVPNHEMKNALSEANVQPGKGLYPTNESLTALQHFKIV